MIQNGLPRTIEYGCSDCGLITEHPEEEQRRVFDWIRENIHPRRTPLLYVTSYGLKHRLQSDTGIYLTNNEFYGGYIAIGATGPSPVAVPDALNYVITGNTISEARSKGIYITDVENALIENNTIKQSTSTTSNYNSIDIYRNTGNLVVRNNVITHTHDYYSQGIYMRQGNEGRSENEPMLVYNNSIVIANAASGSVAGIQVTADSKNIAFYNNTVRVSGSNGYVYYTAGSGNRYTGIKMQNNLLQNFTTSGKLAYINSADDAKALIMNNNALYAASGTLFENHAATIDDLNALDNKQDNFVEQAEFLSDIDNHLLSAGNLNAGVPVDFITTDAEGNERNAQAPTIGAYEFAEVVVEKPEIAEGYPTVTDITETTATVKSKWTVGGKLYCKVEEVTEPEGKAPKAVTASDLLETEGVDITADTDPGVHHPAPHRASHRYHRQGCRHYQCRRDCYHHTCCGWWRRALHLHLDRPDERGSGQRGNSERIT